MKEIDKEAQDWLAKHAVLLGPEELPFEEEKLAKALITPGSWPIPSKVQHMGIFAEIVDETNFNNIVGNPDNWKIILDRTDLYNNWIVPQAAIIFGKYWFNRVQWKDYIRRGIPFPLFSTDERRIAKENGISLAETAAGRAVIFRIITRIEHALNTYLSGGGISKKDGKIKQPGGYIVESIANEFIKTTGVDMGYCQVRTRACPNCLTKRVGPKRSEVKNLYDNVFSCEQCLNNMRNLELVIVKHKELGTIVPDRIIKEFERAKVFCEFSSVVFICPSNTCYGHFVPADCVEDQKWWQSKNGKDAKSALLKIRIPNAQTFRDPPLPLMTLPLCCPFCYTKFTPISVLKNHSGFRGQSGKMTGLPFIFSWNMKENRTLDNKADKGNIRASSKETLVDSSCIDPSQHIAAEQRINVLVGELALHAQEIGNKTAPAIISRCFCEAVAEWMLKCPEDASSYFFDWSSGERSLTEVEKLKTPNKDIIHTTAVIRGKEAAIHQTVLYSWISHISKNMKYIRKIKSSKINSLEDIKWFCRPPAYNGGPKTSFISIVDNGLIIPNNSNIISINMKDKPRLAWVLSIRKEKSEKNLVSFIKSCEWQSIKMYEQSGLLPNEKVKVEALIMPGHHCHAPIQRIIRLRTLLLGSIIERIRMEESSGITDTDFWQKWQKRAQEAKKTTGIGVKQGA